MRHLLAPVLALLAAAANAAPPGATPAFPPRAPAEAFARLPTFTDPVLSPNGRMVAAKVSTGGKQVFTIYSLFEKDRRRAINFGDADLEWWRWINDDWVIAQFGTEDTSLGFPLHMDRLVAISVDGRIVPRKPFDETLIVTPPNGSPIVKLVSRPSLTSNDAFILSWDPVTDKVIERTSSYADAYAWYPDRAGVLRFGVGSRRNRPVLFYRATADEKFSRFDLKDVEEDLTIVGMSDGNKLLVIAERMAFRRSGSWTPSSRRSPARCLRWTGWKCPARRPAPLTSCWASAC